MPKVQLSRDDYDDLAGFIEETQFKDGRLDKILSKAIVYGEWDQ